MPVLAKRFDFVCYTMIDTNLISSDSNYMLMPVKCLNEHQMKN